MRMLRPDQAAELSAHWEGCQQLGGARGRAGDWNCGLPHLCTQESSSSHSPKRGHHRGRSPLGPAVCTILECSLPIPEASFSTPPTPTPFPGLMWQFKEAVSLLSGRQLIAQGQQLILFPSLSLSKRRVLESLFSHFLPALCLPHHLRGLTGNNWLAADTSTSPSFSISKDFISSSRGASSRVHGKHTPHHALPTLLISTNSSFYFSSYQTSAVL